MIQKIIPIAASITLIGSASLTAYADNMLDKDYIVREIWSDWWHGKGDDGFIFPEASYKHSFVILVDLVNRLLCDRFRTRFVVCFLFVLQAYLPLSILFKSRFSLLYSICLSIHS